MDFFTSNRDDDIDLLCSLIKHDVSINVKEDEISKHLPAIHELQKNPQKNNYKLFGNSSYKLKNEFLMEVQNIAYTTANKTSACCNDMNVTNPKTCCNSDECLTTFKSRIILRQEKEVGIIDDALCNVEIEIELDQNDDDINNDDE